ncbi:SDR family oxidoreductase [Microcoleus sp. FACHB-1515]|uniref:SDR family NAD(P)-dependent oxidoreductase n=1 Tax=Cyanophyceae TaxID=3028117 RepID=UPI0016885AB3|nr:SDR family NAD(P)-dependent oxidoreductase [Microcoleus sp. FACHB-1515]MBD2090841.1 SDR family oxidoreductase [Microcoleus sp. FACHB-1515]
MLSFANKTVLVTGSDRGIGRAVAVQFAAAGARVALHFHSQQDAIEQVQSQLTGSGHITVQADLADVAAIDRMVNEAIAAFGQIDILVNNAGIYQTHPLDATKFDEWQAVWQKTIAVNLLGSVHTAYAVAQHMIPRRQGRIINITSRGAFRGEPTAPAYAASKAGLNAFSQSIAQHLAPYGISVSAIAPGWVETEMSRSTLESPQGEAIRAQSGFNRVARPEEIAHTVLFLASEQAEFLTGAIVDINGASYLRS